MLCYVCIFINSVFDKSEKLEYNNIFCQVSALAVVSYQGVTGKNHFSINNHNNHLCTRTLSSVSELLPRNVALPDLL